MKEKISKKQLRKFSLVVGIGFPLIIGLIIPVMTNHVIRIWTIYIGLPILILGIINPHLLHYPYLFWMKMGYILGYINSRLILGIVFLFVLQPISLLMKIFGYDPLNKKFNKSNTYKSMTTKNKTDLTRIF